MDARQVAAQFAANVWFAEKTHGPAASDEAVRFAKHNWPAFLSSADEGIGRLLLRVTALEKSHPRSRPTHPRHLATTP
jgi:hypothetical protein